ncbi:tRNA pseudouridine(55) synthase TruB [Botrimarina hoheduenensis]|uniref:tRNA pseudouridine synthase B n=1 Tax=Botrimarina hoheduenensis TaxID=2528000 RepID=A0A5C5WBM0_9BACT|nr:tRNA pseudouridine(55) synthase TruB [Botrimarina hoheduenensis]TWT47633.1 tRNA pseudouridine synthase B [Botrimarina hoheduenensis]
MIPPAPYGLLILHKPAGLTSRDAVNRVQRVLKQIARETGAKAAKVGHAGTLDPIATGVLVVCVGTATRLIEHVQRQPKRYRGTFLLGRRSASDDIELTPELLPNAPQPTHAQIEAALPPFLGSIQQTPPTYSAIKVGGKKSYDLARAGKAPDLAPRTVTIHELSVVRYEYPELVLDLRCGSGTYVRALGRDLAARLGTAAVMSALVRTAIGPFTIENSIDPEGLDAERFAQSLLPAALAVADLPRIDVEEEEAAELRHGRFLERGDRPQAEEIAAFDAQGRLLALVTTRGTNQYQPIRNFS